jgi:transposase
MSTMNANEARLRIHGTITEVLVTMAMDDNATDEEIEALEEEMGELADVIMEDLGVEVNSVNEDKSMNVTLRLFSDEEDHETA